MDIYNGIRRKSKKVKVGRLYIGGDAPLTVQSMTNVRGYEENYRQMKALEEAGCDIIRMTVPDMDAVRVLARLKESDLTMPIVADIHFDYRMAIESCAAGADKVRINPGNIGDEGRVKEVVRAAKNAGIAIRVGVNSGSLEKGKRDKFGGVTPEALAESALENVRLLEKYDFDDIVVAVKSSSPYKMAAANRLIAGRCPYPLHLGVTEAGTARMGVTKGAAGIGGLLLSGIGDTLRVSLTADPVKEVEAGRQILDALGFGSMKLTLVSCPTCGRTKIDIISIAERFEEEAKKIALKRPVKVAVMGCAVNGPGEAGDADFGIAGGVGEAVFFKNGKIERKIPEDGLVEALIAELKKYAE
ncbi:MAG: flavodoxin-dependent (E)-4-hydroxy-3-methylbut-2-enyl-diphosphate synthase [Clostridia bacterium]|nr:flavodoxin-dependent (E)-4-hydroxy-3-methylbut-2-enyl-diphosphate synthase [Clostridia bacterium]